MCEAAALVEVSAPREAADLSRGAERSEESVKANTKRRGREIKTDLLKSCPAPFIFMSSVQSVGPLVDSVFLQNPPDANRL